MALTANNAASLSTGNTPAGAAENTPARAEPVLNVRITLEIVLYVVLALLALALRFAQLGAAPLNDAEAREALAAVRVVDTQAPGEALVPHSPLTFLLNVIGFTLMPVGAAAARLPVALGGVLLALSPVLWRRYLKPLPPLIMSLLLTLSPVGVLASRTLSPVIWSMLLAVIGPWLVLRFYETRQQAYGIAATAGFGALIFLAEPAGLLTLLALVFGVLFAWLTEDDPDAHVIRAIRDLWATWPWSMGVFAAGLAVVLVGTGMFWLPSGLTSVGQALWTGIRGFVDLLDGAPVAYPLLVALRYEIGIVLFGLVACYRAVRFGSFFERVLVGWFLAGLVWALAYGGAAAAHALWIVMPLTMLVGLMITRWITERPDMLWDVPEWGVLAHALITLLLWLAVGMSLLMLGKLLLTDLPVGIDDANKVARKLLEDIYSRSTTDPDATIIQDIPVFSYVLGNIQLRLLITSLVLMLVGVLYFLVGSLWGARTSWYGLALGTLVFLMLLGAGEGWRAAYDNWDDPRELWYIRPVTGDVHELRDSLREMSLRDTGEPNLMPVTALVPSDGALAWVLRDYPNAVFVDALGPEVNTSAVLAPFVEPEPVMGASYIGKDLITRRTWDLDELSWRDALMWYYRSDSLRKPDVIGHLVLWVQLDIYGVERLTEE
ncbi:MAG: hypothetical protein JW966_15755 [Anaerolineae bacterium]|nr:hypothetical protein [Anaerolineae bacterium]